MPTQEGRRRYLNRWEWLRHANGQVSLFHFLGCKIEAILHLLQNIEQ